MQTKHSLNDKKYHFEKTKSKLIHVDSGEIEVIAKAKELVKNSPPHKTIPKVVASTPKVK